MKSGFVMLAGRSNVGKSTLLNALVGTKVAIVTPKPQTTRRPIRGIIHDPRGQAVVVDTPGVFLGTHDPVSRKLTSFVGETLEGVDVIIYVMDPTREPGPEEEHIQKLLRAANVPIIAVINKLDLDPNDRPFQITYEAVNVGQRTTMSLSALQRKDLNRLIDVIFALLPEGESWYPENQITDIANKEWLEELIREKVFLSLEKELPYSVKVVVDDIEDRPNGGKFIAATIWTTEERYKRMIIGAGAQKLKEIGMKARKELETISTEGKRGNTVYLELRVKVDPKWPERFA